jgi:hypothetical protein
MTRRKAKTLKHGAPLWVRGYVRKVSDCGKWIEVQFPSYSLDIPVRDVRLPRKRRVTQPTPAPKEQK